MKTFKIVYKFNGIKPFEFRAFEKCSIYKFIRSSIYITVTIRFQYNLSLHLRNDPEGITVKSKITTIT